MSELNGSCLIEACNDGDLEAVRRLLDEGRNVNEITEEGESLLSLACSSGYYELAQLLLATRANVEDRGLKDTTPLMEAASAGHVHIVKLLLSHQANVNAQTPQGNTPLMYACAGGHVEVVKLLIEHGANVEDHNVNGHTPLMEAASAGHVAVAKILVVNGASINSHSDEFKESALTLACYKGHLEMVRFLLEAGADQEHKTEEMHTALMEASMDGHVEVARLLLDSGAQVNMPADSFESPLTLAACGGHVELVMLLLERGANIEEVNDEGYTPLMEAAREGQEEVVALLLSQGADINAQTEETQETALTLACCSNSLEVAEYLIKAGADIEAGANTPLMEAAQEGHIELVRHLIAAGANVNAVTTSGETALMYACENGHTNVAETLIDAGADLEHEAEGGRTPVMKAARAGHLCTVQFLVSRGANINKATSNSDHTPLSLACAGGHKSSVEYLLSQGADPTLRLKDNSTMLIEAARGGHTKVVQLLIDYPNRGSSRSPLPDEAVSSHHLNITSNNGTLDPSCDTPGHIVHRGSISHDHSNADGDHHHHPPSTSQRKSSISSITTSTTAGSNSSMIGKHGIPKATRSKAISSSCTKSSDAVEPYVPHPPSKARSTLSGIHSTNNNTTIHSSGNINASGKHLDRSIPDSNASQSVTPTISNQVSSSGGTDALSKLSSALSGADKRATSDFIDGFMLAKRMNEMKMYAGDKIASSITSSIASSREQKILHKQKILEELVRVEKELNDSRQERLSLHQKAEKQQQLIHNLCCDSELPPPSTPNNSLNDSPSSPPSSLTSNTGTTPSDGEFSQQQQMPRHASEQHQLSSSQQLNNIAADMSPQAMLLLDMAALKKQVKAGDPLNFQSSDLSSVSGNPANVQQILFQNTVNTSGGQIFFDPNANNQQQQQQFSNGRGEYIQSSNESISPVVPQAFTLSSNTSSSVSSFPSASANASSSLAIATPSPPPVSSASSSGTTRFRARHGAKVKSASARAHHAPVFSSDNKPTPTSPPPPPPPPTSPLALNPDDIDRQIQSMNNEASVSQNMMMDPSSTGQPISEASIFSPPCSSSLASGQSIDNQTIYVQRQQALLELAQSIGQRPDALQLFQQNANFNTNYPLFFPPWVDLSSLDNLPNLQRLIETREEQSKATDELRQSSQQTQATQTLISSLHNMLNNNLRKLASTACAQQSSNEQQGHGPSSSQVGTASASQGQISQATQTPSLVGLNGETVKVSSFPESSLIVPRGDSAKATGKNNNNNTTHQSPQPSGLELSSQNEELADLVSISTQMTNQHLQVLRTHLTAIAVPQPSLESANSENLSQTELSQTPGLLLTDATQSTLSASISSALGGPNSSSTDEVFLEAPAFPVNLNLSPLPASVGSAGSVETLSTTIFQPQIPLEMPENSSSFMIEQKKSLNETMVGDFLNGNQTKNNCNSHFTEGNSHFSPKAPSQVLSSNCFDSINQASQSPSARTLFPGNVGSMIESFNFSKLPVSTPPPFSQSSNISTNTSGSPSISGTLAVPVIAPTPTHSHVGSIAPTGSNSEHSMESQTQTLATQQPEASIPTACVTPLTASAGSSSQVQPPSSVPVHSDKIGSTSSPPPWYPPIDLDSQTDSNHDTALTLACAGGHEELVELLISRGAQIEHRDKKGFTPLMLAASSGKVEVCKILMNHNADIEAQSERTKDTALSLACSSGRYEVVELLLEKGANKEHRNVSDYTPLSLAASGGYVNIIKLLLSHGAEINSRTGSKLGISPLMLAAMNGHAATVKLLLDMGSDINAQIETNRNTALTLACFQGRCEVVSLLLDRKANVEHRAKTGLTPLMEAASGGYVDVGRVLLDKSADVNAPPVPSSRDTALTIAADKGHFRFVELLLQRGAQVDVKNKKGSSPLWLACNGGHLDVVQLLVNAKADIDSQDNRKVSCLMAAFRKGHVKVVKWMVKHVTQFPSDQEMTRYIATITDKELLKKCHQCMEHIRAAKEKQAAEANKNATILLEEIDMERYREETRKQAAARRREKKRQKKKEKQEKEKALKVVVDANEKQLSNKQKSSKKGNEIIKLEEQESESDSSEESDDEDDEDGVEPNPPTSKTNHVIQSPPKELRKESIDVVQQSAAKSDPQVPSQTPNKRKVIERNKKNNTQKENSHITIERIEKKDKKREEASKERKQSLQVNNEVSPLRSKSKNEGDNVTKSESQHANKLMNKHEDHRKNQDKSFSSSPESNKRSNQDHNVLSELSVDVTRDVNERVPSSQRSPDVSVSTKSTSSSLSSVSIPINGALSLTNPVLMKGQKREEGWKEVVRRSKKVSVPANAISRVIGRGGCNINAVREISGAHIEVEKQKGQGDRQIIIKGSADATRHAQQLISGLVNEPDKDLSQIVAQLGLNRANSSNEEEPYNRGGPIRSFSTAAIPVTSSRTSSIANPTNTSTNSGVSKSSSVSAVFSNPANSASLTMAAPFGPKATGVVPIRPTALSNSTSPFGYTNNSSGTASSGGSGNVSQNIANSAQITGTSVWGSPKSQNLSASRLQGSTNQTALSSAPSSTTKTTVSYTTAVSTKAKTVVKSTTQMNNAPHTKFITADGSTKHVAPPAFNPTPVRPQTQPFTSVPRVTTSTAQTQSQGKPSNEQFKQPAFASSTSPPEIQAPSTTSLSNPTVTSMATNKMGSAPSSTTPEYTPFNNLFAKVAQASVWGQSKESQKPNFASVAAAGITSVASIQQSTSTLTSSLTVPSPPNTDLDVNIDLSKAPGYRGNLHVSMACTTTTTSASSNFGPIGSGPRSAPCTPPLSMGVAVGSPSSRTPMSSSSSTAPTTPPPMRSSVKELSCPSSVPYSVSDLTHIGSSNNADLLLSGGLSSSQNSHVSTGYSHLITTSAYSSVSSQSSKPSNFSLASGNVSSGVSRPYATTAQQHGSLPSVESIHPPSVISSLAGSESQVSGGQPVNSMSSLHVGVQSNLNPNAPDFSVRSGSYLHSPSHQPVPGNSSMRSIPQQPGLTRPMPYPDLLSNGMDPTLQMQGQIDVSSHLKKNSDAHNNPYLSFIQLFNQSTNLQNLASLQTLSQIPGKVIPTPYPPPPGPPMAPYPISNQPFKVQPPVTQATQAHAQVASRTTVFRGHPSTSNPAAISSSEYSPTSAETLRLLQTALSVNSSTMHQNVPTNLPQYGMVGSNLSQSQLHPMQAALNLRQQQQQSNPNHPPQSAHLQGQQPYRMNSLETIQANSSLLGPPQNQTSAIKENEMADSEERRPLRPIGTERAQKKNPVFVPVSSSSAMLGMDAPQGTNIWPFNSKMSSESADWLLSNSAPSSISNSSVSTSNPSNDLLPNATNHNPLLNREYMNLHESTTAPNDHSDYNVNYHYFSSNI
ncbi:multiple ankyrin repeats single KH domain isoform X2 [Brevipalpus obovatus]|uniref:multiple ankyrin repeats single KH domain isoform X2 n=1 Tax=Brevipalpus obovatus TaxID=246614 RepID=UPI003D9E5F7F